MIILRQYIKHSLAPYRGELWLGPLLLTDPKDTPGASSAPILSGPAPLWDRHGGQQGPASLFCISTEKTGGEKVSRPLLP